MSVHFEKNAFISIEGKHGMPGEIAYTGSKTGISISIEASLSFRLGGSKTRMSMTMLK